MRDLPSDRRGCEKEGVSRKTKNCRFRVSLPAKSSKKGRYISTVEPDKWLKLGRTIEKGLYFGYHEKTGKVGLPTYGWFPRTRSHYIFIHPHLYVFQPAMPQGIPPPACAAAGWGVQLPEAAGSEKDAYMESLFFSHMYCCTFVSVLFLYFLSCMNMKFL